MASQGCDEEADEDYVLASPKTVQATTEKGNWRK